MFKLLLIGFLSSVSGDISCGTGFVYNITASSCLPVPSYNCCDATLVSCQDAIKLCMATGSATNCQALACPTVSITPDRIQSQYSITATVRASPIFTMPVISTSTTTPKQLTMSVTATMTMSMSVTSTATRTYTQTDSLSIKAADPATTASVTATTSMKPTRSVYPTRFVKYSFSIRPRPSQYVFPMNMTASISSSIIFPKANYTLLRDPSKLQELQIILACILRIPLEGIEITNIATNSMDIPFDASIPRLNSNGQIICINLPSVATIELTALRRLQIADTTVSYNILNPNNVFMTDKNSFATSIATDSNMLSYASSVGSNTPIVIPPIMLFILISPDPSTVPIEPASAGAIVGGIFGGIGVAGLIGVVVLAIVHLRNRVLPIISVKKPSVSISNPINCKHDSHVVFNPVPTRRLN